LGHLLEQHGDVDGALAAYALAEQRGDPGGAFRLGQLLEEQGCLAEAQDAYERAGQCGGGELAERARAALAKISELTEAETDGPVEDSSSLAEEAAPDGPVEDSSSLAEEAAPDGPVEDSSSLAEEAAPDGPVEDSSSLADEPGPGLAATSTNAVPTVEDPSPVSVKPEAEQRPVWHGASCDAGPLRPTVA
jgi:hypothetical protein